MRNKVQYVVAGADTFFTKDGEYAFDPKTMPIDCYLTNAAGVKGRRLERLVRFKEYMNDAGKTLFCDSGGFQLATKVVDSLDPMGIIDVQNRIADRGFILDVPTLKRVSSTGASGLHLDTSDAYMEECLKRTQEHIKAAQDIEKAFKYYAVIQGATYDQLSRWWEGIRELDTFVGAGTKAETPGQILMGLVKVHETPELTSHHILGVGVAKKLVLIKYFYLCNDREMDMVSYDNTTYLQLASHMHGQIPFTKSANVKGTSQEVFEELTGVRVIGTLKETFMVAIRNMYLEANLCKYINMLDTPRICKEFVAENMPGMLRYIHCVDDYFEHGLNFIVTKYPEIDEKKETRKQRSILDDLV